MDNSFLTVGLLVIITLLFFGVYYSAQSTIVEKSYASDVEYSKIIEINYKGYNPSYLVISPNTWVVWINKDNYPHKITAVNGIFEGKLLEPQESLSIYFRDIGDYQYFDELSTDTILGTIVVESGNTSLQSNAKMLGEVININNKR